MLKETKFLLEKLAQKVLVTVSLFLMKIHILLNEFIYHTKLIKIQFNI